VIFLLLRNLFACLMMFIVLSWLVKLRL